MRFLLTLLVLSFTKVGFTQPETQKLTFHDSLGAKRIDSVINARWTAIPMDTVRLDSVSLNSSPFTQTHFFLTEKGTDLLVHGIIGFSTSIKKGNEVWEMKYKSTFDFINDKPARAEIWQGNQKHCAAYFLNDQLIHLWVLDGSIYNPEQTIIASFAELRAEYFRIKLKLKK